MRIAATYIKTSQLPISLRLQSLMVLRRSQWIARNTEGIYSMTLPSSVMERRFVGSLSRVQTSIRNFRGGNQDKDKRSANRRYRQLHSIGWQKSLRTNIEYVLRGHPRQTQLFRSCSCQFESQSSFGGFDTSCFKLNVETIWPEGGELKWKLRGESRAFNTRSIAQRRQQIDSGVGVSSNNS